MKKNKDIVGDATPDEIFAALKVLEAMYAQGLIKEHVWKNIKKDFIGIVDLTQFK